MDDKIKFKKALPDPCVRLTDRKFYRRKNQQRNWRIQKFDRANYHKYNLGTFSKSASKLIQSDAEIFDEMIIQKKSFKECLSGQYRKGYIRGCKIIPELMYEWSEKERKRHEQFYNVWDRQHWDELQDLNMKSHKTRNGAFLSTEENLANVERKMFGDSLSLMDLCRYTEKSMAEITPDSRGLQVLYSV